MVLVLVSLSCGGVAAVPVSLSDVVVALVSISSTVGGFLVPKVLLLCLLFHVKEAWP